MPIERKYSKAKANGNRVVWTGRETIPVPFRLDGLLCSNDQNDGSGQDFGTFRVTGRDMYCHGFRVDFDVPAGSSLVQCEIGMYTAGGTLVSGSNLLIQGTVLGMDKLFLSPLPMPINSLWRFRARAWAPDGLEQYFPQGVTATYYLRYAPGQVHPVLFSTADPQAGVGFDQIGDTLIIQ